MPARTTTPEPHRQKVNMRLDNTTNDAYQHALKEAEGGIYSDLKITCGGKEYPVHKVLLCTRSSFFKKACDSAFKEGESNTIDFLEDDTEAVDSMICYVYNGYYPRTELVTMGPKIENLNSTWKIEEFGEATLGLQIEYLTLHAKVYALAEKYEVSGLKEMALRNFKFIADGEACSRAEFSDACEIAYTTTIDSDRELRDAAVKALYDNPEALDQDHAKALIGSKCHINF
ncbi:hypothetical protein B0J13DRAFT_570183 [Dactylonectria estremocensis]|uniref:BTB domain-containing protein n=1 Tax=Dactylonectria estremocensis TaxID=1079267 RepID=A0A9P9DFK4_9HYPO|nr:hypothetical protein B0J13DRAFT_577945 [Dactylonectria estremocensis]KAH7118032.1 hypothetical protein B0J13DRAFT_570183 [Dactylonectria estremocensis]